MLTENYVLHLYPLYDSRHSNGMSSHIDSLKQEVSQLTLESLVYIAQESTEELFPGGLLSFTPIHKARHPVADRVGLPLHTCTPR